VHAAVQLEWARGDSAVMAVASDATVRVLDAATGALRHVLAGHAAKLYDCAVHRRAAPLWPRWSRLCLAAAGLHADVHLPYALRLHTLPSSLVSHVTARLCCETMQILQVEQSTCARVQDHAAPARHVGARRHACPLGPRDGRAPAHAAPRGHVPRPRPLGER
jgi:hypothetical protein